MIKLVIKDGKLESCQCANKALKSDQGEGLGCFGLH